MSHKNRWILLILLITVTFQHSDNYNQYEISPNLPPTAFIGQYYTVNFRASGLPNPDFTFENLPSCFTGSSTGTIEGIPDAIGSYNIRVSYRNGAEYGQQSVVLRVTSPGYSSQVSKVEGSSKQNINWIQLGVPSLYLVGDRISINLNQYTKSSEYTWSYLQLPQMLEGDASGKLFGAFYKQGYYSFGATCSNKEGNSLDYFFTFNIQPIIYQGRYKVISEVPNRNVFKYTIMQIEGMQTEARLNVQKAQKAVIAASNELGKAKASIVATQSSLTLANTQVALVEKVVSLALKQKVKEFNRVTDLQTKRDKAQGAQALKKTAYNQAVKNTNSIQKILDSITSLFNKLTEIFNLINKKFIDAQNERSQAEADLSAARKNFVSANEDVKSSFPDVLNAKKLLQAANNNKSQIDFNVSAAFDQRDIANFQNDKANSQYNSAEKKVSKALQDLRKTNSTVSELRQASLQAKDYLGQAQFNLLQAKNRLFVAQAAKGQSDKALLIASAQSSILPIGQTTYIFSGCQIGNYPIISGTASIQKTSSLGYQLNSGYVLLFGDCTEGVRVGVSVGEDVNFKGYLRDGYIHGLKIDKN